MSDIPSFPYKELQEERSICSVTNLTRRDGDEFLALAPKIPVHTETMPFPLRRQRSAKDCPICDRVSPVSHMHDAQFIWKRKALTPSYAAGIFPCISGTLK